MAHTDPHGHGAHDVGHETTDVNLTTAPRIFIATGVFLAVVFAFIWFFIGYLKNAWAPTDTPPSAISGRQGDRQPPMPRLQTTPYADLKQFRAAEETVLNGYAWVDKNRGIAQIPVTRAIEIVAEKGLPEPPPVPAAPPAQAPAPPAAPQQR